MQIKGLVLIFSFFAATFAQGLLSLENLDSTSTAGASKDPVTIRSSHQQTDSTLTVSLTLSMDKDVHLYSSESNFFKVAITDSTGLSQTHLDVGTPVSIRNFDGTTAQAFKDGHQIVIRHRIDSSNWRLEGYLQYQACDETMCFTPQKHSFSFSDSQSQPLTHATTTPTQAPATGENLSNLIDDFSFSGKAAGYLKPAAFNGFLDDPAGAGSTQGGFAGKSLLLVIFLTVLGGIALNLTPCVLPMIPITLSVLGAGTQASTRSRGLLLGGIYGLAMALTYGALGVFVILTGTQFGTLNSSPLFNIVIAGIFIILALGMFDIIHIDFTRYRSGIRQNTRSRGKIVPAFGMGIVAALLAGACVAPVVLSVILYSSGLYAEGNSAALLLPFLLGAGMGMPWPLAGAGLSFLPKPGNWMIWVRNIFGGVILAIALYYGWTAFSLYQDSPKNADTKLTGEAPDQQLPWIHDLEEGLRKAQATGKPVLIDFWATWCKNCKTMDLTTFRDESVGRKLDSYILVKYQAEKPNDPQTKKVLDKFGVIGLPTYVVMQPQ
ncbi:MAG: protein-disulfide reductase DsbD family protein [Chitinispirillaceae bacterium]